MSKSVFPVGGGRLNIVDQKSSPRASAVLKVTKVFKSYIFCGGSSHDNGDFRTVSDEFGPSFTSLPMM